MFSVTHQSFKGTQMSAIETLNSVIEGWSECIPGGLICNPQGEGGIIDSAIVSGKWFIIFNNDREPIEGFESRDDAVAAFVKAST
jgi:hypothetical protein